MDKQTIRIIKKNSDYSLEYQIGDIFTVDSTWYGGANVTSKTGIPLSLDKDEYEAYEEAAVAVRPIDRYSYNLGVVDCFCEMVASGVKTLAMSHPCNTKEERDSYLEEVRKICGKYQVQYYPEDDAFLTDLFPEELNKGKYNFLFFRSDDILERYMQLKEWQKSLIKNDTYTKQNRYKAAQEFGRMLSYPEEGIERLILRSAQ